MAAAASDAGAALGAGAGAVAAGAGAGVTRLRMVVVVGNARCVHVLQRWSTLPNKRQYEWPGRAGGESFTYP